jgi:hypothetical protein
MDTSAHTHMDPRLAQAPSVAFPYKIGCGLGGGDWAAYLPLLVAFARAVPGHVRLYHQPPT